MAKSLCLVGILICGTNTDGTVARTKKIIAADEDIASCSTNAAFVITIATEMFIQHIVKQSYQIGSDKRQKKLLAYGDLGMYDFV
jgi:Histone-like transcription factor (CBF/NF-Y) and archaeal histone